MDASRGSLPSTLLEESVSPSYDKLSSERLYENANQRCRLNASPTDLKEAVRNYRKLQQRITDGETSVVAFDVRWRMSKAMFFIAEIEPDDDNKKTWLSKAEFFAEKAMADCSHCVEGYYYAAAIKGRIAEISGNGLKALKLVKRVLSLGQKAVEIDESFENGAPLRLLAMLYAKAPPWPASVGDMDLALETAQRALSISDYPMNHLIMAEVLIEDDELEAAVLELDNVLDAPLDIPEDEDSDEGSAEDGDRRNSTWTEEAALWRPYAAELKRKTVARLH